MKKAVLFVVIFFAVFIACTSVQADMTALTDEGIVFGGYCYYIENGDIYRAPMTDLAGETELFCRGSSGIALDGTSLVSYDNDGNISIYSLVGNAPNKLNNYLSASYEEEMLLGSLSSKYESNGDPAAISSGNDAGGVSFGAYQFASNAGVPKAFASWCVSSGKAVDIGNRLLDAYVADSNSCSANFKAEWLEIAEEDADFFLLIQHEYVKEKYYDAIVTRVESNVENFRIDMYGIALKNVFWSRSVQHGVSGSYTVITRAFEALGGFNMQSEEALIRAIYAESGAVVDTGTYPMTGTTAESLGIAGKYMKYYSRNSSAVQISVYRRLNINELGDALAMLEKYGGYQPSEDIPYALGDIRAENITDTSAELFGTIYNYSLSSVTEYGFFIGRSLNTLVDMPVSTVATSSPVIAFSASTLSYIARLDDQTTYYFGIYAFIGGEYVTSDIITFVTEKTPTYTAEFINYDGSLLYEITLKKGTIPVYLGGTPVRASDDRYTYTFIGWDKDILPLTADTVYTAVFSASPKNYTVRYFDADGNVIWEGTVSYGGSLPFSGDLPTKANNAQYSFTFSGWSHNGEGITANTDIYPIFEKTDLIWNGAVSDDFGGGDGSQNDPYVISSAKELAYLSNYVSLGGETEGKYFILTNNILLGYGENRPLFTPIGTEETPFSGSFDGCGYIIKGLTVKTDGFSGLFGVMNNASVLNLVIDDAVIDGKISGMICGKALASKNCYIKNCSLDGNVSGSELAGGTAGLADGSGIWLTDISSSGTVSGKTSGGIIGYFGGTSLTNSFSDMSVTGELCGSICASKNGNNLILNCYYFSETSSDPSGKPISSDKLSDASAYSGFDFSDTWVISGGKAELKITLANSIEYYVYGDINSDGLVNTKDAVLLVQYLAGWAISLPEKFSAVADVNADGKVTTNDAVRLAQFLANWNVSLG